MYLPDDPNRRHLLFFRVGATGAEHIGQRVVTLMTRVLEDVRVVRQSENRYDRRPGSGERLRIFDRHRIPHRVRIHALETFH